MSLRGEAIQRWWPTTRCLDLVEGPVEAVAAALEAEVTSFLRAGAGNRGPPSSFRGASTGLTA
jgi:hypothetical protein